MSMSIGDKIKELRTKANLTQNELAAKLFVSRELVCSWELGNRNPSLDVLNCMAELFGVDVHELVCMDSSSWSDCHASRWRWGSQALISTVQVCVHPDRTHDSKRDTCGQHAAEYISSRFQ